MKAPTVRPALACAVFLCSIVAIPVLNAQGQTFAGFAPQQPFPTGVGPVSVAIGDLNGDGALDMAVTNAGSLTSSGSSVSILLGDGIGGFTLQSTFSTGTGPVAVKMGDLNGDGALDLVVANGGNFFFPATTVSILLGTGTGLFSPQQTFPVGSRPDSVAIGDLNGDGALDLAVANANSSSISILLGNGAGSFAPQTTLPTGTGPASVSMGDLNGDGALDLVVADAGVAPNFLGSTISILLGNGAGAFAPQVILPAGTGAASVAMGDLNGDGALDLVVTNHNNANVSILLGDGLGSFTPQTLFTTGTEPVSVVIVDLNGDGALDLAVADSNIATVSVLLGDGAGSFMPHTTFATGTTPVSIAMGDLNGDSAQDLALVNFGSNSVSTLINLTTALSPADFNGDGFVDASDLATLLAQWGSAGSADLDADGIVNAADLATLLGSWG